MYIWLYILLTVRDKNEESVKRAVSTEPPRFDTQDIKTRMESLLSKVEYIEEGFLYEH